MSLGKDGSITINRIARKPRAKIEPVKVEEPQNVDVKQTELKPVQVSEKELKNESKLPKEKLKKEKIVKEKKPPTDYVKFIINQSAKRGLKYMEVKALQEVKDAWKAEKEKLAKKKAKILKN